MTQHTPGTDLLDAATSLAEETVELRREIHRDPELGLHLPRTQSKITEALTGLGLDITLGESTTSVVADLDTGKPGPTVLLRGDMDALPMHEDHDSKFRSEFEDRSHACGHDSHVAMLVSAARLLSENQGELTGKIRFMFQPGEEGFHGARYMIDEGVLDGVDRAFAIHVITTLPSGVIYTRPGPLMASADRFEITVSGKGGHASMPHFAVDPIPAAAAMVTGLHTMVGRDIDANKPAVVTVAHIQAGSTNNVIPETAFLEGTMRSLDEGARAQLQEGVRRVTQGMAAAHGCTCSTDIIEGYPVTINNPEQAALTNEVADGVLGTENSRVLPTPVMGAEDFSYVLNQVPGAMAFLGACPADVADPSQAAPNHSNYMRLNEEAMHNGVAMYAAMALARP